MKCSAFNVDFNGVRFDPLGSRSPPYERIKCGYPLENVRFLLVSTNLAREWLQIDTDLLRIITSTAEFSLKYTGDRPRQPAYEIKLMLSRVS